MTWRTLQSCQGLAGEAVCPYDPVSESEGSIEQPVALPTASGTDPQPAGARLSPSWQDKTTRQLNDVPHEPRDVGLPEVDHRSGSRIVYVLRTIPYLMSPLQYPSTQIFNLGR